MPVSTSLSASSLNESAGARTPVASLVTGALVILTLVVLAPLFSDLPKAVLAAVIIDAVVFGMIDLPEFRRLRRVAPFDFWISVAAVIGVLSFGVLAGVVVGIVLSLGWLISVTTSPPIPELGRELGTQVFRDLDEHPGDETFDGIVVLRLDSGLFFATAQALDDRVRDLAGDGVRTVVLDLEAVPYIDSQGSEQLGEILRYVESQNATLRLARLKPNVRVKLERDGVLERLGADHVHGNVHRAVEAALAQP
jgi:sulfate permease, SulP family